MYTSVLAAVVTILAITWAFGRLLSRIGQPAVVGEIFGGIFLGPTILGFFFPELSEKLFSNEIRPFLVVLSNFGLSIFMFVTGLEVDFSLVGKKLARETGVLVAASFSLPFLLGIIFGIHYFDLFDGKQADPTRFAIFSGIALAITAFPVLARILAEHNLQSTWIGTLLLLSASVQDILSLVLLTFAAAGHTSGNASGYLILYVSLFVTVNFVALRPLLAWVYRRLEKKHNASMRNYLVLLLLVLLINSICAEVIGVHTVFGGFVTGLAVPRKPGLTNYLLGRLKDLTMVLLLPLFFALTGLNTNLRALAGVNYLFPATLLLLLAVGGKYFSTLFTLKYMGYGWREASGAGGLNNAKGLMELVIASIGLSSGIISAEFYSILVVIAMVSTLLATPIFRVSKWRPVMDEPIQASATVL